MALCKGGIFTEFKANAVFVSLLLRTKSKMLKLLGEVNKESESTSNLVLQVPNSIQT